VTRHRHHAIGTIVNGMLITPARRQPACRPLSHARLDLDQFNILQSDSGIAIVTTHRRFIQARGATGVNERSGRRCAVVYIPIS